MVKTELMKICKGKTHKKPVLVPMSEFHRALSRPDGLCDVCKTCNKAKTIAWYRSNTERGKAARRKLYLDRYAQINFRRKHRNEGLIAYGGKCECCGENRHEFLAIDHIDGTGGKHRKEDKYARKNIFAWLKSRGYPKDNFRLLCHNCNGARAYYGYCPHELAERLVLLG